MRATLPLLCVALPGALCSGGVYEDGLLSGFAYVNVNASSHGRRASALNFRATQQCLAAANEYRRLANVKELRACPAGVTFHTDKAVLEDSGPGPTAAKAHKYLKDLYPTAADLAANPNLPSGRDITCESAKNMDEVFQFKRGDLHDRPFGGSQLEGAVSSKDIRDAFHNSEGTGLYDLKPMFDGYDQATGVGSVDGEGWLGSWRYKMGQWIAGRDVGKPAGHPAPNPLPAGWPRPAPGSFGRVYSSTRTSNPPGYEIGAKVNCRMRGEPWTNGPNGYITGVVNDKPKVALIGQPTGTAVVWDEVSAMPINHYQILMNNAECLSCSYCEDCGWHGDYKPDHLGRWPNGKGCDKAQYGCAPYPLFYVLDFCGRKN